jgi:hypothetical protein
MIEISSAERLQPATRHNRIATGAPTLLVLLLVRIVLKASAPRCEVLEAVLSEADVAMVAIPRPALVFRKQSVPTLPCGRKAQDRRIA